MLAGVGNHDLSDLQQDGDGTAVHQRRGDIDNMEDDDDDDVLEESVDDSDSERDAPAASKQPPICLFSLVWFDLFLTLSLVSAGFAPPGWVRAQGPKEPSMHAKPLKSALKKSNATGSSPSTPVGTPTQESHGGGGRGVNWQGQQDQQPPPPPPPARYLLIHLQ